MWQPASHWETSLNTCCLPFQIVPKILLCFGFIYILSPCCVALFILHRFETVLLLMGFHKHNKSVSVHLFVLFIYVSSVLVSARVVQPLLKNYGKPIFRSNFHSIYDTSNYGVFHLSNGLALTPQMGFVSISFVFNSSNQFMVHSIQFIQNWIS